MKDIDTLTHASFFFIDIVSLSNPMLSTISQIKKIKFLNDCLAKCNSYKTTDEKNRIVFPTGDGFWIAFFNDIEKPITLAIELHKQLQKLNSTLNENEQLEVRIGCHSGDVFFVKDLNGINNIWGPGIIMSRRVMDTGDSGHILMTSTMAENLIELSEKYEKIIHPIHDFKIKHGEILLVYSVYGDSFGNPNRPTKGMITKYSENLFPEDHDRIYYKSLELSVHLIDPNTNRFKISRKFSVENKSEEPIYKIYDIIQTENPVTFADLNVKYYDENDNTLELIRVHLDMEHRKEYSLKINKPILYEEKNREITITYETILSSRFFEYFSPVDIDELFVYFVCPSNSNIVDPNLFVLDSKDRKKLLQDTKKITRGVTLHVKWNKINQIKDGYIVRLEC